MKIPGKVFLLLAAALLGGCLSRPRLAKEYFAFITPPAPAAAAGGPVLEIRRISVAPPFDSPSLTYRTGDFSYERDPYAGLLVSPGASLAEPVRTYLRGTGIFGAVPDAGSVLKPNLEMEISVPQFYGDFRDRLRPQAVLELQFIVFEPAAGRAIKTVLQKTYAREIPLKTRTAAAVVAGWNEALKQIMAEVASDLRPLARYTQCQN